MSFCIDYSKGVMKYKNKDRLVPYYSTLSQTDNYICIYGCEYHKTQKDLEKINLSNFSIEDINNINESFSWVIINKTSGELKFVLSKYGIERLYYYKNNQRFIISDDYWEILSCLDIEFDDLDVEAIEESLNCCYPLFDSTYTKNIYVVLPGTFGRYYWKTDELSIDSFFDFRYLPKNEEPLEDRVNRVDSIIKSALKMIKEECGDVKYSFGLSGGLDSRIIPHYMQNEKMDIRSFIIGNKKPNKLFVSSDHSKARKIAEIFKSEHHECEWSEDVLKKTICDDLRNNPLGVPQFFKGQTDFDFDVLISGGNGYLVGSTMPDNIESLDSEELAYYMRQLGRDFKPNTIRNAHIRTAIKHIFKIDVEINHDERWYHLLLSEKTEERIKSKFIKYVEDEKKKGKTNIDIYEMYFHNILGARNKFGGFESLVGTKRSFSIYLPHVLDDTINWPLEYLQDRKLLKELIIEKIPEVANVKEQKYEGNTITGKSTLFNRLINIVEFVIRGNGSEMINSNFKKTHMFRSTMENENEWFYRIFDVKPYLKKIYKHDNKYALMKIWKTKLIIDLLETKGYKSYNLIDCYTEIDFTNVENS